MKDYQSLLYLLAGIIGVLGVVLLPTLVSSILKWQRRTDEKLEFLTNQLTEVKTLLSILKESSQNRRRASDRD